MGVHAGQWFMQGGGLVQRAGSAAGKGGMGGEMWKAELSQGGGWG